MILSNNPRTFITIEIYTHRYRGITYREYIYTHRWVEPSAAHTSYIYRWTGPSAVHIFNLRSTIWNNSSIEKLRSNL